MKTIREIQTVYGGNEDIIRYLHYPFVETDAGRSESYWKGQLNDCTVRALALAKGISYNEAFDICMEAGRPWDEGFMFDNWALHQDYLEYKCLISRKGMIDETDLHKFCNPHFGFCTGTWMLRMYGHILTVIEGVVHDTKPCRPSDIILGAWKV